MYELDYYCALACKLSYPIKPGEEGEFALLRSELMDFGYNLVHEYDQEDTQFSVFMSPERIIIAFRGTESIGDLVNDARYYKMTPYIMGGRVSSVVLACANQVFNEISDVIELYYQQDVIFTGHSYGAAVATIAAFQASIDPLHSPHSVRLITFGSPRVVNAAFGRIVAREFPYIRWVNKNDVITKIPWLFGLFRHVPRSLKYINLDQNVWIKPCYPIMFLDRWRGFKNSFFNWASDQFLDHLIDSYVESMRGIYHGK